MTLTSDLNRLEAGGLLQLSAVQPELEYLFRHVMVQDAAYATLVRADRRELHLAAGEALERLFPDRLRSRDLAPRLGQHFLEGGDDRRALAYFAAAGEAALLLYANVEAAGHFNQALKLATRLTAAGSQAEAAPDLKRLYRQRGLALERASRYDEAIAGYEEMERLSRERGDSSLELAAVIAQAHIFSIPGQKFDALRAEPLLDRVLAMARELNDQEVEARALWYDMLQRFFSNRQELVRQRGEQALALARALNHREMQASILNDLAGFVYVSDGDDERAQAALEESRGLWRELGNLPMLSGNLTTSALNAFMGGKFDAGLKLLDESLPIARMTADLWGQAYCQGVRGQIDVERGEVNQAIAELEETIALGALSFAGSQVIASNVLAMLYGWLGDVPRALAVSRNTLAQAEQRTPFWLPQALGCRAMLDLQQGDLAAAKAGIQRGLALLGPAVQFTYTYFLLMADCELGLATHDFERSLRRAEDSIATMHARVLGAFVPHMLYYKGRALIGQTQPEVARQALHESVELARGLGSRNIWWRALGVRAALEATAGNGAEALAAQTEAREVIQQILARTSSPDLRASFAALPEVRQVMRSLTT